MRKHRLSGVVIAALIGLGTFTHRPDSPHRTPGAERAGIELTSAKLPAGHSVAAVLTRAAVAPDELHVGLLHQLGGHSAAVLALPFSPQILVQEVGVVQVAERAQARAYLAAVAWRQALLKAYLTSLPAPRPHPVAVAAARAAEPAPAAEPVAVAAPAAGPRDPFAALRQCESGGNYGTDTGNGYYGAYQFTAGTWRSLGFGGLPSQAPPAVQDRAARELQARRGWGQWPSCARRLGLI
jgi:hypothetical protein